MRALLRLPSRELVSFLAVGGAGYLVDVVAFNRLLDVHPFVGHDPTLARIAAMAVAMVVTFAGNALITWRDSNPGRREIALFVVLNVIGLGFSVGCLWLTHDVLGLTSRLMDNISANGIGLALGTAFRYVTYRLLVFRDAPRPVDVRTPRQSGTGQVARRTIAS